MKRARDSNGDHNDVFLMHAAVRFRSCSQMKTLLARGVDVNAKDKNGNTPFQKACWSNYFDIARLLVENGADINAKDRVGWTPLHRACSWGHLKVVKFLLIENNGVDLNVKDNKGKTPLHIACGHRHLEITKLLVENGADLTTRDIHGWTPLHGACQTRRFFLEDILILIDNGADINAFNDSNNRITPLYWACWHGSLETVQLLLSRGADVNMKTTQGSTALHIASERNHREVVWFLLRQYPCLVS